MSTDRINEIKEKLESDDLSSHKRDKLKRELNKLQSQRDNGGNMMKTAGVAALALLVIIGGGYALTNAGIIQFSMDNGPSGNAGAVNPEQISAEGEPVLGNPDAEVTVVLFEDFQCPVCKQFTESVFPRLKQEYGDNENVKFVWKDFPLTQMHDWAGQGANTMECVYRQDNDAFWAVKEKVFANQGDISIHNAQSKIIGWAEEEGVNGDDVRACMNSENPGSEVQSDLQEGRSLQVSGTPTVFINGKRMRGMQPYGQYRQVIENELNRIDAENQ